MLEYRQGLDVAARIVEYEILLQSLLVAWPVSSFLSNGYDDRCITSVSIFAPFFLR